MLQGRLERWGHLQRDLQSQRFRVDWCRSHRPFRYLSWSDVSGLSRATFHGVEGGRKRHEPVVGYEVEQSQSERVERAVKHPKRREFSPARRRGLLNFPRTGGTRTEEEEVHRT